MRSESVRSECVKSECKYEVSIYFVVNTHGASYPAIQICI